MTRLAEPLATSLVARIKAACLPGFFDKAPDGNGGLRSERIRFIIVNSREVIMIAQIAPEAVDDQQEWFEFEDSLNIR